MVHPLRNILNKLRWDTRETAESYIITYRHRGAQDNARCIKASSIRKLGKSYFTISDYEEGEEATIPFHRVLEIRNVQNEVVVWKSRRPQ